MLELVVLAVASVAAGVVRPRWSTLALAAAPAVLAFVWLVMHEDVPGDPPGPADLARYAGMSLVVGAAFTLGVLPARCWAGCRGAPPTDRSPGADDVTRPGAGYVRAMLLRPLRRAPMMLGGVGFQVGLDEARRKQAEARRKQAEARRRPDAPDVVEQLKSLKALQDDGALSPDEFRLAKQRVLGG